jgi:hypothetical protein
MVQYTLPGIRIQSKVPADDKKAFGCQDQKLRDGLRKKLLELLTP